jgi:fatty-acid desaturase
MISEADSDAVAGRVIWMPVKSIWIGGLTAIALIGGPLAFTWDAFAVFIVLTGITICLGHSVGMHRLLIHRSFKTHIFVEHFLVYLGTLVGMAGPFGMIYAHDIRDWAQRQRQCHDLFAHRRGHQGWSVDDVAVQGYNLPRFGLVTFGESFHGNHHAFPESARLGLEKGQLDLGWHFIHLIARSGLATAIKLPSNTVPRAGLRRAGAHIRREGMEIEAIPTIATNRGRQGM